MNGLKTYNLLLLIITADVHGLWLMADFRLMKRSQKEFMA